MDSYELIERPKQCILCATEENMCNKKCSGYCNSCIECCPETLCKCLNNDIKHIKYNGILYKECSKCFKVFLID